MRVNRKQFSVFINVVLIFSIFFSSVLTPNQTFALTKPAGVGDWFTTDPTFENGQIKIGDKLFPQVSCPNGWSSSGDICKACFLSSAAAPNLFVGKCPFDPTTVHQRSMFFSESRLPDSSGGLYYWGIWTEYESSSPSSSAMKSATLVKVLGSGINSTAQLMGTLTLANPGAIPPPTVPDNPVKSEYFGDPYIYGLFVDNTGTIVPGVPFKITKVGAAGADGTQVPATAGTTLTGYKEGDPSYTSYIEAAKSPNSIAGGDGSFITVSGKTGLKDGTYKIEVDYIPTSSYIDSYLKEVGSKLKIGADLIGATLFGGAFAKPALSAAFNDTTQYFKDSITQGRIHMIGSTTVTISGGKSTTDLHNVKVTLNAIEISELDKALSSAMKAMADFTASALRFFTGWVYNLLTDAPRYVLSPGVEGAWTNIRNVALSLLVLALIIIAFANVLQVDIETYGLNRMIPRIILAIIFTSFSWLIVEFFFDFTAAIQAQAVGLIGGKFGLDAFQTFQVTIPQTGEILGKMGVVILFVVLLFIIMVCSVILWFSLIIRTIFLAFLVAVAPLAFIFSIMPFTETLYKRWWTEFWKWMFMGPVAIAIISLGYIISYGFNQGATTISYADVQSTSPSTNIMMGLVIFGASMVIAATLPAQWGGQIMKSWRGLGKKGWGLTGGNLGKAAKFGAKSAWQGTGVPGGLKQVRGSVSDYFGRSRQMRENAWAQKLSGGKVGTDKDVIERKLFDAQVAKAGDNMGVATAGQPKLIKRWNEGPKSEFEKAAIMRQMADFGDLDKLYANQDFINPLTSGWVTAGEGNNFTEEQVDDAKMAAREKAGMVLTGMQGRDQSLEKTVKDKQAELFYAAQNGFAKLAEKRELTGAEKTSAKYSSDTLAAVNAGQQNKTLKEKRMNILDDATAKQAKSFISSGSVREAIDNPTNSSDKVRKKISKFIERMDKPDANGQTHYNRAELGDELYESLEYFKKGGEKGGLVPPPTAEEQKAAAAAHTAAVDAAHHPDNGTRFDG